MKNEYSQHSMCINMLTLTDGIKFNAAKKTYSKSSY